MTPADRPQFVSLLADVLGFYGQPTSPFALEVWWQACQPFELPEVQRAMTSHATDPDHGHFAPKPADVIRQLRGDGKERGLLAWTHLLGEVRRVGSYGRPDLDPQALEALDSLGGWSTVCRSQESDLQWMQKRFCDAYSVHQDRQARGIAIGNVQALKLR